MTTNPIPAMPLAAAMRTLADMIDNDAITESAIDDMLETMINDSDNPDDPALADFALFAQSLLDCD